jgi:hypothetical protein
MISCSVKESGSRRLDDCRPSICAAMVELKSSPMSPGGETACGQEEQTKNYFRSSASAARKALHLAVKRAALPERPDAAD